MPVDPTQTPQAVMDPQGSAIQMPSAEDAASSPGGAAQQQKSAPAQAAPVAAPAASVGILPVTATSSSPHLHSFISRVLSAFAGTPPTQYTTDASGRVIPAPDQKPEPNINKVGRIISHALVGLSAPNPGGPPSILSGMGAGFAAQQRQAQATDQAAQGKAREDFEQEQQTKLRQLDIAKSNALNLSLHESNLLSQNERDTDRAQSKQIADAFRSMPGEEHDVREMSAEAAKAAIFDPNNQTWAHTHLVLPAGFDDVKDSSGNRLKDSDGNYKTEGRVYVIGGMKDGKVALPASIVSDIQKYKNYGDLASTPGLDGLKEGDEYDAKHFIRLYNAMLSAKKEVVSGWGKPEAFEGPKGEILQRNTVNGETKPATEEQADAYKMRKAKLAETQSITKKNLAEAAAKAQDGLSTNDDRAVIAESMRKGRMDPSQLSKRSKDYNAVLAEADKQEMEETGQHFNIAQAQTDYKYANNAQTKNTLNMINGMTEPGGALEIAGKAASKLPKMNSKTANQVFNIAKTEFGDNALTDFHTSMLGLADEYSKVMGGGVSSDTGRQQALDILKENYSKGQLAGAIQIMRSDIAARKKAIIGKNRYLLQEYGEDQAAQPQNPPGGGNDPFAAFGGKKR